TILLNHKLIGVGTPKEVFTNENLVRAYGINRVSDRTDWMAVDDTCCGDDHNHD
ncbi:MAG: hypothetical protein IH586_09780, partial [Anaerolineaceae bacterium]|nr:hypothetical protein [Anaerolineaceae bacterium]